MAEIDQLKGELCAGDHLVRILQAVRLRDVAARVEEARSWWLANVGPLPRARPARLAPPAPVPPESEGARG